MWAKFKAACTEVVGFAGGFVKTAAKAAVVFVAASLVLGTAVTVPAVCAMFGVAKGVVTAGTGLVASLAGGLSGGAVPACACAYG